MEYVYAALLLHSAKQKVDEANVKKVITAAGAQADDTKVKALVASLEGVNIEEAIKKAAMPVAVAAASTTSAEKKEEKKAEKSDSQKEEEAAGGLAALFG